MRRGASALMFAGAAGLGWTLACLPPAPPRTAPPAPEAQLTVAPPSAPEPPPPSAPVVDDVHACVTPPDPELEKESPWSQEIGRQLGLELPNVRHCTRQLPPDTRAELRLRLVYGQDGRPLSQHVVSSSPEACAIAECVKQELADVNATKLLIDRGSYDLALVLERDKVPEQLAEPIDPLGSDDAPAACVDPEIARLSHGVVREVVSGTYDKLKDCYGQALVRNHEATGTVTFEFVIGQQGEMESVQARESTLADCGAVQCMLAELRPLHFPAPVGRAVRVIYPIKYLLELQQPVKLY
jgi:hypothetical protein